MWPKQVFAGKTSALNSAIAVRCYCCSAAISCCLCAFLYFVVHL